MVVNLPGEEWRKIEGYPFYSVSNMGRVKRDEYERFYKLGGVNVGVGTVIHYEEKLLTQTIGSNGYYKVTLHKDRKMHTEAVHRLVAKAFVKNPLGLNYVNHKDENKLNNRADNLEWVTPKENANYGTKTDRMVKKVTGRKRAPMSDEQKAKLSAALKNVNGKKIICGDRTFNSAREAAEHFQVVPSTFRSWVNGRCEMPQEFRDMGLRYGK